MTRRYDIRRVKIHRSYSLSEAAKLLVVTKHTIRRWTDDGLPLIERKRPWLVHGSDLRAYLKARQPRKQPCRAGQIYCVRCRAPKRPAFDEVDFISKTPTTGLLAGLCPTCASMIYRVTKSTSLAAAVGDLKVTPRPAQERLNDSSVPFSNVQFQGPSE
jgi:excisionase family DNA binding protein